MGGLFGADLRLRGSMYECVGGFCWCLLDECVVEVQNWILELRICSILFAFCHEFNGDNEDARIRNILSSITLMLVLYTITDVFLG